ncbi:polysaccharide biosynthesis protein [Peribacillus cavernae]|uniref:Polysaccharide biosynthesis protein n=1 Tax=Peribacillus cavernae TaxID=1674310 RepID=A0A433HUN9_9BACI|nr:polysaccharide biosynthesis protein [Peribacillus cavernae]MDQ0220296.1 O-antigen/teichoic acid export membrane protein [Peribacillus cavernae]RUQ31955.1 polysaccharide biosynthesis protein [Peribacillus cavernae]
MSSKLLRGTFILTLGMVLSKVLGLLYVIPFDEMVGPKGAYLYQFAYVPYTLFISLATGGLPLAVSKFVSKYNALGEYAVGQKLFKSGLKIMLASGFLAFLLLYISAPAIAGVVPVTKEQSVSTDDITTVIRAVSFALILVPFMSLIRGYFQGHQSMGPTAVSQVVEQLVRIIVLLGGIFVVLKVMDGSLVTAISVATFAATVGAVGGLAVLLLYWKRRKPYLDQLLLEDRGTLDYSLKDIYKEILISSIPFIFVGIAMPLFQVVDTLTFTRAMVSIGLDAVSENALGLLNVQVQKLVIIPMTLATAFSMSIVPSITKAFVEDKMENFSAQLNQAFQILLFLTIPAVAGMSLLAKPVYSAFYGYDPSGVDSLGISILQTYAPTAIFFTLFSVTAAVLQGINQQKFTVLSLLVGILIKLSLNIPLIKMFETEGSIYATTLGYLAACLINMYVITYFTGYRYKLVIRRTLLMFVFTVIMMIVVFGVESVLTLGLNPEARFQAVLITAVCAIAGAAVYFILSLKSQLAQKLFGNRIERLQKKLKLKA